MVSASPGGCRDRHRCMRRVRRSGRWPCSRRHRHWHTSRPRPRPRSPPRAGRGPARRSRSRRLPHARRRGTRRARPRTRDAPAPGCTSRSRERVDCVPDLGSLAAQPPRRSFTGIRMGGDDGQSLPDAISSQLSGVAPRDVPGGTPAEHLLVVAGVEPARRAGSSGRWPFREAPPPRRRPPRRTASGGTPGSRARRARPQAASPRALLGDPDGLDHRLEHGGLQRELRVGRRVARETG